MYIVSLELSQCLFVWWNWWICLVWPRRDSKKLTPRSVLCSSSQTSFRQELCRIMFRESTEMAALSTGESIQKYYRNCITVWKCNVIYMERTEICQNWDMVFSVIEKRTAGRITEFTKLFPQFIVLTSLFSVLTAASLLFSQVLGFEVDSINSVQFSNHTGRVTAFKLHRVRKQSDFYSVSQSRLSPFFLWIF